MAQNKEKFIIIYPSYIDSKISYKFGRRFSKTKCIESPTIIEIAKACSHLGFKFLIEADKGYPRELFKKGRVKVFFSAENQKEKNEEIKTKTQLILALPPLIAQIRLQAPKQKTQSSSPTNQKAKTPYGKGNKSHKPNKSRGRSKGRGRGRRK
ncbi:signal recognition particle 19 kda protein [Anaeramoeba ignava]|uniref:Signal recognition particle 19 kDa protein n=1 Tax=Anaeramoeba ignava TaxID=1746090 RepID=A0A9Q0LL06_ANAIG|nr:signal recognition particle 19 kda protein [Anaeramoeba ignava]